MHRLLQPPRFVLAWAYSLFIGLLVVCLSPLLGGERMWLWCRVPWAKGTLALLNIRLKITGAEHLAGPGIFIANHTSLIDVVIMPAIVPRTTRIVAKRELTRVPFVGWGFAASGALLIDRRNARLAAQSLMAGIRALPKNWSLLMFPEGTRSPTGTLQRFKRGAFSLAIESRLPIVPVGLAGASHIIGPKGWFVHPGVVSIHVGAPLPSTDWGHPTLKEHIATGQEAVAACVRQAHTGSAVPNGGTMTAA